MLLAFVRSTIQSSIICTTTTTTTIRTAWNTIPTVTATAAPLISKQKTPSSSSSSIILLWPFKLFSTATSLQYYHSTTALLQTSTIMTTSPTNCNSNNCSQNEMPDIEDLHRQAVLCKSNTYMDPSTGFTVFTEYAHLKRGTCCGNKCRHCPYGWENVVVGEEEEEEGVEMDSRKINHGRTSQGKNDQDYDVIAIPRMASKVKSGDKEEIATLLENIHQGTYFDNDHALEFQGAKNNSNKKKEEENKNEKKKTQSLESFSLPSLSCTVVGTTSSSMSTTSCCSSSSSSSSGSSDTASDSSSSSSSSSCSRTIDNDIITWQPKQEQERQRDTFKNVPYTRSGDMGMSVLLSGERRSKDDQAFESMGTVDELCSTVGVVHAELDYMTTEKDGVLDSSKEEYVELQRQLVQVMCHLFDIGSHLAKPRKNVNTKCLNDHEEGRTVDRSGGKSSSSSSSSSSSFQADGLGNGFHKEHIDVLERWIDGMTDQMPELLNFILPTGSRASSQLHVARCVCRRAERRVQPLVRDGVCDPNAAKYLNRLSDYLFTAARYCNFVEGREEVQYKRPTRATKQRSCVTVELRDDDKKI